MKEDELEGAKQIPDSGDCHVAAENSQTRDNFTGGHYFIGHAFDCLLGAISGKEFVVEQLIFQATKPSHI